LRSKIIGLIAAGAAALTVLAASPAGAMGTATVSVVHGIPGALVNVCVDGSSVADNFAYTNTIQGAVLPAGSHDVKLVAAGSPCSSAAILSASYDLTAGVNYTIVANLNDSGAPNLLAFTNNVRKVDAGNARLTIRHTADAPAVNVYANGAQLIDGKKFTWSKSRTFVVPKGAYRAKVTLPDSKTAVIGPAKVTLDCGYAYQVYAVGSSSTYALVVVSTNVDTK